VITVNDWINDTAIAKFSGHHHNDGDNKPSSILINGKGVLKTFNSSGQIVYTPRAVFSVEHGKAYRFRLINAGILYCPIEFSIDEHNLTVIASDGDFIEPFEVESLVIYAGQ
jgi:FtsP/CotA-like multicopper oxidase with cupredoxin domain